jgi:hypothetical protein
MSAEEERAERRALLGLALASLENEDDVRSTFRTEKRSEPPTLSEALDTLNELTKDGRRSSHRVLYLSLLAKIARRRGAERLEADGDQVALYDLLQTAVDEGEAIARSDKVAQRPLLAEAAEAGLAPERPAPEAERTEPEERTREHLSDDTRVIGTVEALRKASVSGPGVLPGQEEHHWTAFANKAQEHLNLTPEEVHRPLCTDDSKVVMPNGKTACRTAVWFWSAQPASEFARWTDPREWATDCSLFFKSVELKAGQSVPADATEFEGTFTETVCVDGDSTLSTDLVFRRSVQGTDLYALEFDLPTPVATDAEIVVDAGQVTVRHDENAPPERATSLLAEKYILFDDPAFADWPTVACDLFWTEFAIVMALGCAKDQ